jgi:hypothetical protein
LRISFIRNWLAYSVLLLLLNQLALGVGELDVELCGTEDYAFSSSSTEVVSELAGINTVVHEQELQILRVADQELLEAVGQKVLGFPGLTVAALD